MIQKTKYLLFFFFFGVSTILITLFLQDSNLSTIEELNFVAGLGFDIDESGSGTEYTVPISIYQYAPDGSISSYMLDAKGPSTVGARIDRQLHSGRNFSLGTEKVYILSKNISKHGIGVPLDGLLNNTQVSNRSLIVTTSNDPKDVLALNVPDYISSSDYIEGLILSLQKHSFTDTSCTLFDAYVKNKNEGQKFITPNIDIINNKLYLTSFSVFQNGKLVASIPIRSIPKVNILKNSNSQGIYTYSEDDVNFITFDTKVKRNVKCKKINDTFHFDISILAAGKVANNNYMNNLSLGIAQKKDLEARISNNIKRSLESFIINMKDYYQLDLLDLGYIAASKYGRNKIANWNEEIVNSTINISVDFTIDEFGIGNIRLE